MLLESEFDDDAGNQRVESRTGDRQPELCRQGESLDDGQLGMNNVILRHEADDAARKQAGSQRLAINKHLALRGREQPAEQIHQGGFPLAGAAQNADELPGMDFNRHLAQDRLEAPLMPNRESQIIPLHACSEQGIHTTDGAPRELKRVAANHKPVSWDELLLGKHGSVEIGAGRAAVMDGVAAA